MSNAYEIAERLRKTIKAQTGVTVSLGVSSYQEGVQKMEELISKADDALYLAKRKGRNLVKTAN